MHRLILNASLAALLLSLSAAYAIDPREQRRDTTPPEQTTSRTPRNTSPSTPRPTTPEPVVEGFWLIEYGDTVAVYAEQRNVRRAEETTTIWTTWVNRNEVAGAKYAVRLMEIDCENRLYRSLSDTTYTRRGSVVETYGVSEVEYVIPGSVADTIVRAACQPLATWFDTAVQLQLGTDVIDYTDMFVFGGAAK